MAITPPPIPLEDIVLSPAQGFWPLAIGWWLLLVSTIILISWLTIKYIHKRKQTAFYRKQLKILDSVESYIRKDQMDNQELFKIFNRVLKLFLIHYAKDVTVVPLSGEHFKRWVENKTDIAAELIPIFDDSIYKAEPDNLQQPPQAALIAVNQFRLLISSLYIILKQPSSQLEQPL